MATIKYFIKTKSSDKLASIYVRFIDGRKYDVTAKTSLSILPKFWSTVTNTIRQKSDFTGRDRLKNRLKKLKEHIEDEHNLSQTKPKEWLKVTIDKFFNPEKYQTKQITFLNFCQDFVDNADKRINAKTGRVISNRTVLKYKRTLEVLKEFIEYQGFEPDFKDIDINFYNDFTEYLRKKEKMATNTIGKYIKTLKLFLNEATEVGINSNLAYRSQKFTAISEESDSIYLTIEEINAIYKIDLSKNKPLDKVRDLFVLGCWTGLRFSDMSNLSSNNIHGNFLHIIPQKTLDKVVIPIHPTVRQIISKYDGKLPNNISNQKFNEYIKDIAELAEINENVEKSITKAGNRKTTVYEKHKLVTSHTARRSFATNLYKSGFPSISIMKITGHQTEKAFLKYIKVTPEEHAKLLEDHWKKSGLI